MKNIKFLTANHLDDKYKRRNIINSLFIHHVFIVTANFEKWLCYSCVTIFAWHHLISLGFLFGHVLKPETPKRNHRNETTGTAETTETAKRKHRNETTGTAETTETANRNETTETAIKNSTKLSKLPQWHHRYWFWPLCIHGKTLYIAWHSLKWYYDQNFAFPSLFILGK